MERELPDLPSRTQRPLLVVLCLTSCLAILGCQQGSYYSANSLPQGFAANPIVDINNLDLSQLASSSASSQRINPGDSIEVTFITGAEDGQPETWPLVVAGNGTVNVPLVGPVQIAGLNTNSAQDIVRDASIQRGIYRQPSVAINVREQRTNRITVVGAVNEPGDFDIPLASSSLLSAISAAGGLTDDADVFVEIRQPPLHSSLAQTNPTTGEVQMVSYHGTAKPVEVTQVNLIAATMSQASPNNSFNLRDGSVVNIRKQSPRFVHVIGLVNNPDKYELPPNKNVHLLDAVAMAGDRTMLVADRILIVRQPPPNAGPQAQPVLIETSIEEAKENPSSNILLADGDVISIEETASTVMLGAIQQFVRIGINGLTF